MNYGYVRVSTADQTADSQKSLIARYVVDRRWTIDEWLEVEMSSRRSQEQRRLTELVAKVGPGDTVIVAELSHLGRSIREVLGLIEELINQKKCRLICVKQGLDVDPGNQHEMTTKVLLTVFSMMAELERDFISERTREGLRARKERGIVLGKPKGVIQKSIYDVDRAKIEHLYGLGVPINTIIRVHLGYGRYSSLKEYLEKRKISSQAAG